MSEHMMPIPSRLYNAAVGGHVAGADQIIDDETGLTLDKVTGGALEEKEYTSGSDNGMGRVVLRKNLVNGVNTLTQSMMTQTNTIYVIQYDFTLGEDITVPENCVLEFDGGSISGNGTGKDTITGDFDIISPLSRIFKNCKLSGYDHPLHSKWFCVADNSTDDTSNLQNLLDSGREIIIDEGKHRFTSTLHPSTNIKIYGNSPYSKYSDCCLLYYNTTGTAIQFVRSETLPYPTMKGIHIIGRTNSENAYSFYDNTICVDLSDSNSGSHIEVEDCYFENFETIFKSNNRSYYNSFHRIRCFGFRYSFIGFDANNLRITESRISKGFIVIYFTGGSGADGPVTIDRCCMEGVERLIYVSSDVNIGKINLTNNYVEITHAISSENYLIYSSGSIRNLSVINNELQVNSVFRVFWCSVTKTFISVGNDIQFSLTKTHINALYNLTNFPSLDVCIINDGFRESAEPSGDEYSGYGAYTTDMSSNAFPCKANCVFNVIDPVNQKLCRSEGRVLDSAHRPTGVRVGFQYYDTTLHKPLWSDGNGGWYDATGTPV